MSAKVHRQSQKMGVFLQGIGNSLTPESLEIPLMPQKLTDTAIRTAKPKEKPWKLTDGGGLYVLVSPTGGKLWRLKYRYGGKEKLLALGAYPFVSLKDARVRAIAAKELLARGIDPSAERKAAKVEATAAALTFEKVAREWYAKQLGKWTPRHASGVLRRLEVHAFPELGARPIAELGAPDFLAVLHKVEKTGHIETARRVAQICGQVTRYARLTGIVPADAASGLTEALTARPAQHFAAITEPEKVGHLLRAIDEYQGEPSTCYALRILPYVFIRSSELRGATWDEIDLEKAEWLIPAERMKMKRPHIVPLARQVVELFTSMRQFSGDRQLVSPGLASASRPITDVCLLNALRRMGYARGEMTIHGFRSMASTLLNEQGYNRDWIERQLAHCEKNAVRAAYNHAEYLPERRRMMQEWADYLDGLRAGAEV